MKNQKQIKITKPHKKVTKNSIKMKTKNIKIKFQNNNNEKNRKYNNIY